MKSYGTTDTSIADPAAYEKYRSDMEQEKKDRIERRLKDRVLIPIKPEIVPEIKIDPLVQARSIIDEQIIDSQYFRDQLDEKGIKHTDTASNDYLRLLSTVTTEKLDDEEGKASFIEQYGEDTYHAVYLLATAPYALRQQDHLNQAENRGEKPNEHAKETVIKFNHAMMDLVEAKPDTKMDDLANQIDLTATSFDENAQGTAYNAILDIAHGIRTEYAFWQAVNYSVESGSSYKIRHGTDEEDRRGIDFVVTLPDGTELKIDVKSSETGIRDKAGNGKVHESGNAQYSKTYDGQYAYHLKTDEDTYLDGTFVVKPAAKIGMKMSVLGDLQKMANL